jgi:hypothetical protein
LFYYRNQTLLHTTIVITKSISEKKTAYTLAENLDFGTTMVNQAARRNFPATTNPELEETKPHCLVGDK